MKNIHERTNSLIEEINQNDTMSEEHKKVYRILNYIEHLLILISKITGCVSISSFSYLVGISIENTSSAIRFKICVITAGIKNYKSIIKESNK